MKYETSKRCVRCGFAVPVVVKKLNQCKSERSAGNIIRVRVRSTGATSMVFCYTYLESRIKSQESRKIRNMKYETSKRCVRCGFAVPVVVKKLNQCKSERSAGNEKTRNFER